MNTTISVAIPTCNRPALLRDALESVRRQSARAAIAEVIVSENCSNAESKSVCGEFADLPIVYLYQEPSAFLHLKVILERVRSPLVAILHDDDWWECHHLANGLSHLRLHPDASAYWTTSFFVYDKRSWIIGCWNISVWMVAGFPALTDLAKLDAKKAALACVCNAPAHYSTLIARTDVLVESYNEVLRTKSPLDSDRMLFLALVKRGPALVNLVPQVFIRRHAAQEQEKFSSTASTEHMETTTRSVLAICRELGLDVAQEFNRLYDECPVPEFRDRLIEAFDPRVLNELRRQNALPFKLLHSPTRKAKWLLQQACPPFLWRGARELRRIAGK